VKRISSRGAVRSRVSDEVVPDHQSSASYPRENESAKCMSMRVSKYGAVPTQVGVGMYYIGTSYLTVTNHRQVDMVNIRDSCANTDPNIGFLCRKLRLSINC
jgi:hypothetical protein